jgi:hypothetical protein
MARAPPVSCPGCAVYVGPTCQSALPCNHIPSLFFETHTSTTLKMKPPSAHVCSDLLCSPLPRSRCSNHRLRRATTAASPCSRSSTPLCSASPRQAAPRPRPRPLAAQSPSSCLQPLLVSQARLPPRLPADAVEPSISGDLFVSGEFAPFSVLLHFHFFPASRCLPVLPRLVSCRAIAGWLRPRATPVQPAPTLLGEPQGPGEARPWCPSGHGRLLVSPCTTPQPPCYSDRGPSRHGGASAPVLAVSHPSMLVCARAPSPCSG